MNKNLVLKLAASGMVLGTVAVGHAAVTQPAGVASAAKAEKAATRAVAKASALLRKGKADKAVAFAEQAVALAPQAASHRALLGQVYLMAGRFTSAETALTDSLTLSPDQPRVALNLVLAEIALGKWDAAKARLAKLQGKVPEGDRGLALALAGDTSGAIAVLEQVARGADADAKARQNLALAYALEGDWARAKSAAAQDLAPEALKARLREWALFSQPKSAWDQVAGLLKVTPVEDAGQPTALALVAPAPEQQQAEVAEPAAEAVVAADAEVPAADPAPVASVEQPAPAPIAAVDLPPAPATPRFAPPKTTRSGRFVVQLGAYSTPARVETAWNVALRRNATLAGYTPASATVGVARVGTMYRLTLAGFESRGAADRVCNQVRARGGMCFVRTSAGEKPVQWVSKSNRNLRFAGR